MPNRGRNYIDRIFGRNEGNESRDLTNGRGYGEGQQFYDEELSDPRSEWNRKSDLLGRRPGPRLQAMRNRPTHQRASDSDRDFSSRYSKQDDYQGKDFDEIDNGNRRSENSMWNDTFNSERNRASNRGGFFGKGPKGWKRSDERIKEEVSEALFRDYHVDASDIEVDVKEGVVTLSGTVESRNAKKAAEVCIENLTGVIDVHNRLRIQNKDNISNLPTGKDGQEKSALS